jgi:iron complex outermembrane receptor protein
MEPFSHRVLLFLRAALLPLGIFVAAGPAAAGTGAIRGVVKGPDGPIVGAAVRLLELDRAARTDAGGGFMFANVPDGAYTVVAAVIGYASATRAVRVDGAEASSDFALRESAVEVEGVVVSAAPYAQTPGEQYQPAATRPAVELHQSAGGSVADKLSDLPGVAVRGNGTAPNRPVLRGLSDNRVLVLENGLRTGDVATYDPAHATPIEALSAASVDVVRGPASILYGPSTIGGLVNVITNTIPDVSSDAVSGIASLEGNTVSDQYAGYLNAVLSDGHSAFGVTAGGVHAQDLRVPDGVYSDGIQEFALSRLPQSFFHSDEASLGYAYQGEFGMAGIGGKFYEMNYGIPGTPPNDNWETLDDPAATSRIFQSKKSVEARGLFAAEGPFLRQVRWNANYVDYQHAEYPTAQDSSGVYDFLATQFHKKQFNGTLQFQHQPGERARGVVGLWTDVEDLSLSGEDPLGPNSITTGIAGYLFEEYLQSDRTRFQAGVRFDYNRIATSADPSSSNAAFRTISESRTSNAVTASLGAITGLAEGWTAAINVARSFRAPTVQELFADGLDAPSGTYTIGDADLRPEVGYGVDLSVKGRSSDAAVTLTPYVNVIHDYVYGFLTGADSLEFPVRRFGATNARLVGIEASFEMQIARNIGVQASGDYVEAQDTRNDVPLPFTPPARGLLRLVYRDGTYSGSVEWRLAARQTRLGDGDTPTPGYGVVNVGAGVRFAQAGLVHSVGIHCDNLLNKVYRDHLSVIKDFIPQPARGLRLNYDLIF